MTVAVSGSRCSLVDRKRGAMLVAMATLVTVCAVTDRQWRTDRQTLATAVVLGGGGEESGQGRVNSSTFDATLRIMFTSDVSL